MIYATAVEHGWQLDDLGVLETLAVLEDLLALDPVAPDLAP